MKQYEPDKVVPIGRQPPDGRFGETWLERPIGRLWPISACRERRSGRGKKSVYVSRKHVELDFACLRRCF